MAISIHAYCAVQLRASQLTLLTPRTFEPETAPIRSVFPARSSAAPGTRRCTDPSGQNARIRPAEPQGASDSAARGLDARNASCAG